MTDPTYSDGGELRCSNCGSMCLTHYAANLPGESYERNDLCLECAAPDAFDFSKVASDDAQPEPEPDFICPNCGCTGGCPVHFRGQESAATGYIDEAEGCTLCDPREMAKRMNEATPVGNFSMHWFDVLEWAVRFESLATEGDVRF